MQHFSIFYLCERTKASDGLTIPQGNALIVMHPLLFNVVTDITPVFSWSFNSVFISVGQSAWTHTCAAAQPCGRRTLLQQEVWLRRWTAL